MERAGEILWGALRRVSRPKKPLDLLAAVWPIVVGQPLAAHTQPLAWAEGVVEIAVGDREWQEQLEGMAAEVQAQINRWWGSTLVQEVRFVRGKVGTSSARRPAPASGQPVAPEGVAGSEGEPSALLEELEGPLTGIADKELRDLVARAATQYLVNKEKNK